MTSNCLFTPIRRGKEWKLTQVGPGNIAARWKLGGVGDLAQIMALKDELVWSEPMFADRSYEGCRFVLLDRVVAELAGSS